MGTLSKQEHGSSVHKVDGVTVHVSAEVFNDYELLESLHAVETGENQLAMVDILKKILGDDYTPVKEHLRNSDGIVTVERMGEFLAELMQTVAPK